MTEKIFAVLEAVSQSGGCNSVNSISKELGLPRSTAHRIMQDMRECGMLVYVNGKGYTISAKLKRLCLQCSGNTDFLDVMIPIAREVSKETGETVSINILIGMERTCVYRVEGLNPAIRNVRVGDHSPLFVGSAGKLFPAYMDAEKRQEALAYAKESGVVTNKNIVDVMEQMQIIRQQGYSLSLEERYPGCWSIAVPIIGMISEELLGTLSISGLLTNYNNDTFRRYLEILLDTAKKAGNIITA